MANAEPDINHQDDSSDEGNFAGDSRPGTSKQNGIGVMVDRHGFLGGAQYTNPDE